MAAAPRFDVSLPFASGAMSDAAAISPATPTTTAALPALAAVGEAFTADVKRTAAASPAAPTPSDLVNPLQELEKQIATDWNTKYFSSFLTPVTFEDVRHFTPLEILDLCCFNITAILLDYSTHAIGTLLRLMLLDPATDPKKETRLKTFDIALSKVTLPKDKQSALKNNFGHCIDLFYQLKLEKYQLYLDQPLVKGLPILPQSPKRIGIIFAQLDERWRDYIKESSSDLTERYNKFDEAYQKFVKAYESIPKNGRNWFVQVDVNSYQAKCLQELLPTVKTVHRCSQATLMAMRVTRATDPMHHSTLLALNCCFNSVYQSIHSLTENFQRMEAVWHGKVFPSETSTDLFFNTWIKDYSRIISTIFNFENDAELTKFAAIKLDGAVEKGTVVAYFNIIKKIPAYLRLEFQMASARGDKPFTPAAEQSHFLMAFNRVELREAMIDSWYALNLNNRSKAEETYLRTWLKLFFQSCKRVFTELYRFAMNQSNPFPALCGSRSVRVCRLIAFTEQILYERINSMILDETDLVGSLHSTLHHLNNKLIREVIDPSNLESYAKKLRAFATKEIESQSPELITILPPRSLFIDLERQILSFSVHYQAYLNLSRHSIPPCDDVSRQAKAVGASFANLLMEFEAPKEGDEKTEADSKDLAEVTEGEIERMATNPAPNARPIFRGKRQHAAAQPAPKKAPKHTVKPITASPAKAMSIVTSTDPIFLINSIVKKTWLALGIQSFQQLGRMNTPIRIRVADAMIALDQVSACMTAIFRTSHPTIITYLDGELNRVGYNFHHNLLSAAQLLQKGENQRFTHNISESAKRVFGEHAPRTIWTTMFPFLGFSDRFAGFQPILREGELKASRENNLKKSIELIQMLILILKNHARSQMSHIAEIEKEAEALRTVLEPMPSDAAVEPSATQSPAAPSASAPPLITPDFFLPFQAKIEASLKNLTSIKAEIEVEIKAAESNKKRLTDLTRAFEHVVSSEHLLRLASSVPTLFQELHTPEQWHLIYNLLFFATRNVAINIAWLRAIKQNAVILNNNASSLVLKEFRSRLDAPETRTLHSIWNIQTAEMHPMAYLDHCKKTDNAVSPLVETLLQLQELSHLQRQRGEIPYMIKDLNGKAVFIDKLQTSFTEDSTALMNLLDGLIMGEMPDAIKALVNQHKTTLINTIVDKG